MTPALDNLRVARGLHHPCGITGSKHHVDKAFFGDMGKIALYPELLQDVADDVQFRRCPFTLAEATPVFRLQAKHLRVLRIDPLQEWPDEQSHCPGGCPGLKDSDPKLYGKKERAWVGKKVWIKRKSFDVKPSIRTTLRIAAIQAVETVDLILSPIDSCSSRLLNLSEIGVPQKSRRPPQPKVWLKLKQNVEALLKTDDSVVLPSKAKLFDNTGLSSFGFWQHYPELSLDYQRVRSLRQKMLGEKQLRSALILARRLVSKRIKGGRVVQVRRDGAVLMRALKVSKSVAEKSIHSALAIECALPSLK